MISHPSRLVPPQEIIRNMTWRMFPILIVCLAFITTSARAATVLSNLENDQFALYTVTLEFFLAQSFFVGDAATAYVLDSVSMPVIDPDQFFGPLGVWIYDTDANNVPGNSIGALSTPVNPSSTGSFTYTPTSPLTLTASTRYWVVAGSAAGGMYSFSQTSSSAFTAIENWSIPSPFVTTGTGSWDYFEGYYIQMEFAATAVPEPTTLGMASGGALLAGGWWVLKRRGRACAQALRPSSRDPVALDMATAQS